MRCNNCGHESEQDFVFCAACGAASEQEYVTKNIASERVMAAAKDNLFLALCVLLTVSCGMTLASASVPVIAILITVFLWLIHSNASKGVVDTNHMRVISGAFFADYVLNYVLAGLLVLCGAIVGAAFELLRSSTEYLDLFFEELGEIDTAAQEVLDLFFSLSGAVIAGFFIVIALFIVLLNIFGYRKIHKLAKQTYESVDSGNIGVIENANGARVWLIAFGVFGAIGAFSSLLTGGIIACLAEGCSAAASIIAAILVKKYIMSDFIYV